MKVIAIAGSLRKGSFNAALLRAAVEAAPPSLELVVRTIAGIPIYDGDLEHDHGFPEPVAKLKEELSQSQGLLIATPEYNNSIPGVLKNAIDWMSRPSRDIHSVFGDKAVALMGATPGRGGTRLSQAAWLPVFRTLGMRLFSGASIYVADAMKVFDSDGKLIDEKIKQLLKDFMTGFEKFI